MSRPRLAKYPIACLECYKIEFKLKPTPRLGLKVSAKLICRMVPPAPDAWLPCTVTSIRPSGCGRRSPPSRGLMRAASLPTTVSVYGQRDSLAQGQMEPKWPPGGKTLRADRNAYVKAYQWRAREGGTAASGWPQQVVESLL
jgi:hypothetical protein